MGAATGKLGEATTGLGAATIALKDTAATIEATLQRSVQAQMYVASSGDAEPERTSEPEPIPQATDEQHDPDAEEEDEPPAADAKTSEELTPRKPAMDAKEVIADYKTGKRLHDEDEKSGMKIQKLLSPEDCSPCAELRDAPTLNFRNMKIEGDLSGVDLSYADFYGADLTGCNLQRANLTRCDLALADMTGVDLRGACLFQARIVGAKLAFASLERARLIFCDGEPKKNVRKKMDKPTWSPNDYNDKQLAGLLGVNEFDVQGLLSPDTKSFERAYERVVTQADKDERDLTISKWRDELMKRNGWSDAWRNRTAPPPPPPREVVDLYQVVGNDAFYSGSKISRALMVGGNFRKSQFNKTVLIQANLGNAMMRG